MSKRFDKEVFIESVKSNLKTLYRQTLVDATKQQVFQAVSYAVKDTIIDNWMETQKVYEEEDPKMVYYMSMEFLMGRALGNNMINLTEYKEVKEALEELGFDLNVIEDRNRMQHLETAVLAVWLHASLTLWQHLVMQHTAAVSVTAMVCSNRKSKTVIR